MGLSIHYRGKIKSTELIPEIVDELKDICAILKWKYNFFDDEDVKGIVVVPPECEPLFFLFSESVLLSPLMPSQPGNHPFTFISVKTQYAGMEVHKVIIKLLRHLKEKYFVEFELKDEGLYWETNDETVLQQQFEKYDFLVNAVGEALRNFKTQPGETVESLSQRIEKFLKERFG